MNGRVIRTTIATDFFQALTYQHHAAVVDVVVASYEEDELVIKYYKQESSRLKRIGWSLLATRKRVREIQNGS